MNKEPETHTGLSVTNKMTWTSYRPSSQTSDDPQPVDLIAFILLRYFICVTLGGEVEFLLRQLVKRDRKPKMNGLC